MVRTGWLGIPAWSGWPWQREDDASATSTEPPRQGLVLAGGGSRASFEIGALSYLYDHTDFHPTAITGTSAGSIVMVTLAQSADRDEQRRLLAGLEEVWRGLREQADMFAPREWFQRVQVVMPDLAAALESSVDEDPVPERRARLVMPYLPGRRPSRAEVEAENAKEPGPDQHFHPLLGFGPESEELGPAASWNPQAVTQAVGVLGALGRLGGDLPGILSGLERSRALYRPGRILRELLAPTFFSPARVAASGVDIRLATVCLDTGQLRYVRQDGVLVDRQDVPVPDVEPLDLTMGVLASCSIPGVFAPVPLGDAHYVDGGVRENLPVEACVGLLGAPQPVVLVCAPPGLAEDRMAGHANVLGLLGRTASILSDECLRDEVAYARSTGCRVIEPEVDVHDAMTVDPGLIDINIAYGWMRAQEMDTQATEEQVRAHRRIITTRMRIWSLENTLFGPVKEGQERTPEDVEDELVELVEQKFRLRSLVDAMPAALLPDDAPTWWGRYEHHAYPVVVRQPWLPLEPPSRAVVPPID